MVIAEKPSMQAKHEAASLPPPPPPHTHTHTSLHPHASTLCRCPDVHNSGPWYLLCPCRLLYAYILVSNCMINTIFGCTKPNFQGFKGSSSGIQIKCTSHKKAWQFYTPFTVDSWPITFISAHVYFAGDPAAHTY